MQSAPGTALQVERGAQLGVEFTGGEQLGVEFTGGEQRAQRRNYTAKEQLTI